MATALSKARKRAILEAAARAVLRRCGLPPGPERAAMVDFVGNRTSGIYDPDYLLAHGLESRRDVRSSLIAFAAEEAGGSIHIDARAWLAEGGRGVKLADRQSRWTPKAQHHYAAEEALVLMLRFMLKTKVPHVDAPYRARERADIRALVYAIRLMRDATPRWTIRIE